MSFLSQLQKYIKSVLKNILDSDKLELQLILCASFLNDKFGNIEDLIKNDRIKVNQKLDFLHSGNTLNQW